MLPWGRCCSGVDGPVGLAAVARDRVILTLLFLSPPSAVIAGGVIGFLFAIFLILLLVYRMRKKDEGSYDLGERKPSGAAYQKAPTKEFYA